MITHQQLEQFGLKDKEAIVYLANLELGSASVQNIAKKSGIHRVSVYDILESLLEKGFVKRIIAGKKRYFLATEPEQILALLKSRQEMFATLLPELQAVHNQNGKKPKVMYFEGQKAFYEAYFDRIRHQPELKENLAYGSSENIVASHPDLFKRFTEERLAKNIVAKIIVEKSASGLAEKKSAEKELRQVKFWPSDKKLQTNVIIYGDRVMIISWESLMIVIIEDKSYAENQRQIFQMLWHFLPK